MSCTTCGLNQTHQCPLMEHEPDLDEGCPDWEEDIKPSVWMGDPI